MNSSAGIGGFGIPSINTTGQPPASSTAAPSFTGFGSAPLATGLGIANAPASSTAVPSFTGFGSAPLATGLGNANVPASSTAAPSFTGFGSSPLATGVGNANPPSNVFSSNMLSSFVPGNPPTSTGAFSSSSGTGSQLNINTNGSVFGLTQSNSNTGTSNFTATAEAAITFGKRQKTPTSLDTKYVELLPEHKTEINEIHFKFRKAMRDGLDQLHRTSAKNELEDMEHALKNTSVAADKLESKQEALIKKLNKLREIVRSRHQMAEQFVKCHMYY